MRSLLFAVSLVLLTSTAWSSRAFADKAAPVEMLDEANQLLSIGACAGKAPTGKDHRSEIISAHCEKVHAAQADYRKSWLAPATKFFRAHMPTGLPTTVVYPFAGGDLVTALTVFPDADDITTLSLEPAGDPRSIERLDDKQLEKALGVVDYELGELYRASYSKTMDMIGAMRGGQLPTQLIFNLAALDIHGYELLGMRYFRLDNRGRVVYLTDRDIKRGERIRNAAARNRVFGNVELRFRKHGSKHEQVYRHLMANLDNEHLAKWNAPLQYLAAKGHVAGMTKAASYLLSYGNFSRFRNYLIQHVDWMVSDTTGIPPSIGEPAGFEYETWGDWKKSNMNAGNGSVRWTWKALFASKPHRDLAFRFGYPNGEGNGHMVFMKRGPKPVTKKKPVRKASR